MRGTERLDAPRVWLPRWRGRGLLRLGAVCALMLTAAALLLLSPGDPAGDPAAAPSGQPSTPPRSCAAPSSGPPSGTVGFPLRLTDPAVLAVVRAGERVDILVRADPPDTATGSPAGDAVRVAENLPVLRTVGTAGAADGVLYLAVSRQQADALAAIGASAKISVTVRSPD